MNKKQQLGFEIIAAMKANAYGVSIEEGMEMTVDVIEMTGEYECLNKKSKMVQHERSVYLIKQTLLQNT